MSPARQLPTWLGRRYVLPCLLLLAGLVAAPARAETLRLGGTGASLATMRLLAQAYQARHPQTEIIVLPSLGSGGGIKAVLAGSIQLGLSARALTGQERQAGAVSVDYGRTPLTVAVSRGSAVEALSTAQLVDLYSGRQSRWPDGTVVRLVLRPVGDIDSELLKSLSPAMRAAKVAAERRPGLAFAVSDQDCADGIEKVNGSLGPITLAQILSERRAVKPLALDGVVPDLKSVAEGRYPLVKTLSFVIGPRSPAAAQDFIAYTRSPEGRALLAQTGHALP